MVNCALLKLGHMDGGILVTYIPQNQDIKLKYPFFENSSQNVLCFFSGSVCLLVGDEKAIIYLILSGPLSFSVYLGTDTDITQTLIPNQN